MRTDGVTVSVRQLAKAVLSCGMTVRTVLSILVLVVVLIALGVVLRPVWDDASVLRPQDYMEYWSAGRATLDGTNPYDGAVLDPLQRQIQVSLPEWETRPDPIMMWNPPYTLPFAMVLGAMPWRAGQLLWFVLNFGTVLWAAVLLWKTYRPADKFKLPILLGMFFAPTVFLLLLGQISGLLLLGIAGFAWGVGRQRFVIAGLFAALTAIKPHLFSAFALVLILEAVRGQKVWRSVLSGGLAILVFSAVPLIWNTGVWGHYFGSSQQSSGSNYTVHDWMNPTLGYLLRMATPGQPFRVMFVPVLLMLPAAVIYYWSRRASWNWQHELPFLVLASLLAAPYGAWGFDLVILLLPVLVAAARLIETNNRVLYWKFGLSWAAVNLLALFTLKFENSMCNFWFAPATTTLIALCQMACAWKPKLVEASA
jgi:hypothetical protein